MPLILACLLLLAEPDFQPLVPGDIASTFDFIKIDPASVSLANGEIHINSTVRGYLVTKAEYQNYLLKFDWKIEVPEGKKPDEVEANSGVFVRVRPPQRVWPECVEYQITPEDPAGLIGLKTILGTTTDANAQRMTSKPLGEWNEGEIEVTGDTIISWLNGKVISVGKVKPGRGAIGLQAQRGAVRFRNLRIKTLAGS